MKNNNCNSFAKSDYIKNNDVCGIGNAIVDMQYSVSDEEFAEIFEITGVPKSEMRLVDLQCHKKICGKLKHLIPNKCPGGSAANTIDLFAKLGGKSVMLALVGDDENGIFFHNELKKSNIAFKNNVAKGDLTGTCFVLITPDGERTMLTALSASSRFGKEHLSEEFIANSRYLYFEGYIFSETNAAEAITEAINLAKNNNTKVAISASDVFIINVFRDIFAGALEKTDLLFCNENEAIALANSSWITNGNEAIEQISKSYPHLNVVMTKGAAGARIQFNGKYFDVAPYPAKVIDTTGAGDVFAGAFLYGMLYLDNLEKVAELAAKLAAKVVSQLGARYEKTF